MPQVLAAPLVALGLYALGAGGAAEARERGKVKYVTAKRAYLDAGRLDGLKAGDLVKLSRAGRAPSDCKIDQLADHSASCLADARPGDSFALPAAPPRPAEAPAPTPVVPIDAATRQRLGESEFVKVDFKRSATVGNGALPVIVASIGHTAFVTFNGGQFEQERLELQLDGINLRFAGFRGFAHLTALVYSQEPSTTRFRKNDVFQAYVWDLEMSSREVGRRWTLSVGRVWPHHAPGLSMVDGAQVGYRSKSGDFEIGALGGTLPDAVTLYPTARWIGGLYYGAVHAGGKRSVLRLLRHEARLSARDTAQGAQLELEGLVQAWITRWVDLGAQTRATLGAGNWSTPRFEAARASLGVHPSFPLRTFASFRYLDLRTQDPDALTASLFSTGRWYYVDADVAWDATRWLTLMAHGGAAQRTDTSLGRQYVGADIGFPTLFKGNGGLSLGYQEEFGWIAGRTANLQVNGNVGDKLRILTRVSYFEDALNSNNVARELGLYLFVDGRLYRWLSLRISALTRVGITQLVLGGGGGSSVPVGLVGRAELIGSF